MVLFLRTLVLLLQLVSEQGIVLRQRMLRQVSDKHGLLDDFSVDLLVVLAGVAMIAIRQYHASMPVSIPYEDIVILGAIGHGWIKDPMEYAVLHSYSEE